MKRQNDRKNKDIELELLQKGVKMLVYHPLFAPLYDHVRLCRDDFAGPGSFVRVRSDGLIFWNGKRRAQPELWARAVAHALLHLGMGHFEKRQQQAAWNAACCCSVEALLTELKFALPLAQGPLPEGPADEEVLYRKILASPSRRDFWEFGANGHDADLVFANAKEESWRKPPRWDDLFAQGLSAAVSCAVRVAAGEQSGLSARANLNSRAQRAKNWFISSYPLLGAVASAFRLIEDPEVCRNMQIQTAAVHETLREIYINPAFRLSDDELRFVMAHELLHAALRHGRRAKGRDPYLWNIACDFVINDWLTSMGVGVRPEQVLYDRRFEGMSAEEVYDKVTENLRVYRKLATLRGNGLGDILPCDEDPQDGFDLDAFCRSALSRGLEYHQQGGRGCLPAGLVEEIRALSHPPIPWDVELARWFDEMFAPLEKTRTYARPSRRQSSAPDIPRPSTVVREEQISGRTFGVVLDSSGSMDRLLLAAALGAIASYSAGRDVPAARVVFCDAQAYDAGYMRPEDIAETVKVRGRGGTVLQPGIDLLLRADDFPDKAPILIITDGMCDRLALKGREHAFLIPPGAALPFSPKGRVFRMELPRRD